ncbi:MAG: hypothetical protein MUF63_02585 [Rhodobacteraceae bacterium]|jgi:hypothetical protein|nr:hypothetical protein [Paracoccaceae bacterium]
MIHPTRKPVVRAALGRGFHDHVAGRPGQRFSRRWNHDRFLTEAAADVRDLLSAPEPRLAA